MSHVNEYQTRSSDSLVFLKYFTESATETTPGALRGGKRAD